MTKHPYELIARDTFERILGDHAVCVWSYLCTLRKVFRVVKVTVPKISNAPGHEKRSERTTKRALARLRSVGLVRDLGCIQYRKSDGSWGEVYPREVLGELRRDYVEVPIGMRKRILALTPLPGKGGARKGAGRPRIQNGPRRNNNSLSNKHQPTIQNGPSPSSGNLQAVGRAILNSGLSIQNGPSDGIQNGPQICIPDQSLNLNEISVISFPSEKRSARQKTAARSPSISSEEAPQASDQAQEAPTSPANQPPIPAEEAKEAAPARAEAPPPPVYSGWKPDFPELVIPDPPWLVDEATQEALTKAAARPAGTTSPTNPPKPRPTQGRGTRELSAAFGVVLPEREAWRIPFIHGLNGAPERPISDEVGYTLPAPPRIPKHLSFGEQLDFVLTWYRLAVTSRTGRPCKTGLWGPSRQMFEDATQVFLEHDIRPGAWVAWSCDELMGRLPENGRRKFNPPMKTILSAKRMTELRWQFREVEGVYCPRRFVRTPEGEDISQRWSAMEAHLLTRWPLPPAEVAEVLARYFPGGYDEEKRASREKAELARQGVVERIKRGEEWLWPIPRKRRAA